VRVQVNRRKQSKGPVVEIEYIKLLDSFQFPIVKNKRLGISLSAGADSALLTYIMFKYYTDTIYVFTSQDQANMKHNTFDRTSKILQQIQMLTNNNNTVHIHDYTSSVHTLFNVSGKAVELEILDVLYTGTNALPPPGNPAYNAYADNADEMKKRDPDVHRQQVYSDNVVVPFTNIDKRIINELYISLGIRETVLPLTLSCRHKDRRNHCRSCAACAERVYGFGEDYGETNIKDSK
jgi:7-cyano-7-deazaguanine synthase in queuosine biosynthesis